MRSRGARKLDARGFSLVEALIALLVLSIGLLGIASLYNWSLQAGRSAVTSTHAVTLASDMADRISANPAGGAAYDDATAAADNGCDGNVGGATNCTPTEMAQHDLFLWQQSLALALPQGGGDVTFTPGTPATYNIAVSWTEPGVGNQTYMLTVER